jgi:hypothetical protein
VHLVSISDRLLELEVDDVVVVVSHVWLQHKRSKLSASDNKCMAKVSVLECQACLRSVEMCSAKP